MTVIRVCDEMEGFLSVTQNDRQTVVFIEFDDRGEHTFKYPKDYSLDEIKEDLIDYEGFQFKD